MRSGAALSRQSSNRDLYREAFLGHVHRLLQLGYEALDPSSFAQSEEDDISGELRRKMQHLTEDAPTEEWMRFFAVHEQDPVNDTLDEATQQPRQGKSRPKVDFRLVAKGSNPNPRFCVEAKRLHRSDSLSKYVDDEGLGAFISEYYAAGDDAAGMLGYVQSDTVAAWLLKLTNQLAREETGLPFAGGLRLIKSRFRNGPLHTYRTRHRRRKTGREIDVFHTFFVFC
jgi:hypothetical protein